MAWEFPIMFMGYTQKSDCPVLYGRGPAMDALPLIKEWNELPSKERSAAIREYGNQMIESGEWP